MAHSEINRRARVLAAWRTRHEAKGEVVIADEIWRRIQHNWPTMDQESRERVFQMEPAF
jgi:hypothetical protein